METPEEGDNLPPRIEMSAEEFEALTREAISELPEDLRKMLHDVVFTVESYAPEELLDQLGVPEDEELFGLYEGAALTERSVSDAPSGPPRVRLFYEAILDDCVTIEDVKDEVRTTILHEIGHHFGLDEDQLERLGYG